MPFALAGAGIGAIGSFAGAGKQADATKSAAKTQADAINQGTQLQRDEFNTVTANEAPYKAVGDQAAGWLSDRLYGLTYGDQGQFKYDTSDFENDPAFQSSMKFGEQALERTAASKGGLLGGAEQKSVEQFGVDTTNQYFNQDYSRAFNTFNSNRDSIFNKLMQVTGTGLNAATGVNAAGMNFANNASDLATQAGNVGAASIVGQANAGAAGLGGASASIQSLLASPSFQSMLKNYGSKANNDASSYAKSADYDYSAES